MNVAYIFQTHFQTYFVDLCFITEGVINVFLSLLLFLSLISTFSWLESKDQLLLFFSLMPNHTHIYGIEPYSYKYCLHHGITIHPEHTFTLLRFYNPYQELDFFCENTWCSSLLPEKYFYWVRWRRIYLNTCQL